MQLGRVVFNVHSFQWNQKLLQNNIKETQQRNIFIENMKHHENQIKCSNRVIKKRKVLRSLK